MPSIAAGRGSPTLGRPRRSIRLAHDDPPPPRVLDALRTLALEARERSLSTLGALAVEFAGTSEVVLTASEPRYTDPWPSASVLIPVRGAHDKLKACLRCIGAHTPDLWAIEVIIACQESEVPGVIAAWDDLDEGHSWPNRVAMRYVTSADPQGYAANVNLARSVARARMLVILNSDAYVAAGWLDRLHFPLRDSDVVASGPVAQVVVGSRRSGLPDPLDPAFPSAFNAVHQDIVTNLGGAIDEDAERLVGFCLAVRAETFDAVGGMHEGYGIGNFDDDDFCLRLRCLGRLQATGLVVAHSVNASFNELPNARRVYEESMRRGRETFLDRWGWWLEDGRIPTRGTRAVEV